MLTWIPAFAAGTPLQFDFGDGCFVAGTPVETSEGLKRIEDIQVGDLVQARDTKTGATSLKPVVKLFRHHNQQIFDVKLTDPSGQSEIIGATAGHPFHVRKIGWVAASKLVRGETVDQLEGKGDRVAWVKREGRLWDTYNFQVAEFHSYFVGQSHAWVHNISSLNLGSLRDSVAGDAVGYPLGERVAGTAQQQGSITYLPFDSLGRPTGVQATITEDMIGTGTKASQDIIPPGWSGNGIDFNEARGHLLGAQLGGSGDIAENIVTLEQNPANSPVMRGFEIQVRNAVEGGQVVEYSVSPIYNGDNLVPRGVTINASGSGGFNLNVTVLNPIGR